MQCSVVDLSHYTWANNPGGLDFGAAKAAGVQAVIYKVTEGATYADPTYARGRALAQAAGLMWGAFHFGTAAPLDEQLDNFFNTADPDDQTLMCLDFESNGPNPANTMPAQTALDFLDAADARLGRKLTLYTGGHMVDAFGHAPVARLQDRRLWWAEYGVASPTLHPTWNSYWLWQYTESGQIDGLGVCDCNTFDGDDGALAGSWIEQVVQQQA
jgi:lysozyme